MRGAVEVRTVAGKGKGVFATSDLLPGTVIISELPIVSFTGVQAIQNDLRKENPSLDVREQTLLLRSDARMIQACAAAFASMPPSRRSKLFDLDDHCGRASDDLDVGCWVSVASDQKGQASFGLLTSREVDRVVVDVNGFALETTMDRITVLFDKTMPGIILTNGVSSPGVDVTEVYHAFSRLNHSCMPNAKFTLFEGAMIVTIIEAVLADHEVSISYLNDDAFLPADRIKSVAQHAGLDPELLHVALFRQKLFAKWGFWCSCRRCAPIVDGADATLERWTALVAEKTVSADELPKRKNIRCSGCSIF